MIWKGSGSRHCDSKSRADANRVDAVQYSRRGADSNTPGAQTTYALTAAGGRQPAPLAARRTVAPRRHRPPAAGVDGCGHGFHQSAGIGREGHVARLFSQLSRLLKIGQFRLGMHGSAAESGRRQVRTVAAATASTGSGTWLRRKRGRPESVRREGRPRRVPHHDVFDALRLGELSARALASSISITSPDISTVVCRARPRSSGRSRWCSAPG